MRWLNPANLTWLFAHLVVLLLGIIMMNAEANLLLLNKSWSEAIGSGLVATGITGEILFLYVLLSDRVSARFEILAKAGLIKVFPHRSVRMKEEYHSRLKHAKEIDVLGFGQSHFRQDYGDEFRKLSLQATVRVVLIDPDFPSTDFSIADLRDNEEDNQVGRIRDDVEAFIRTVRDAAGLNRNRFKIRLLRAIPCVSLFRIDDEIFWGPYFVGQQSRNTPTFLAQRGGFLYNDLKEHFDLVWESDKFSAPIKL
ncbi:MAG TPA: hypothetical protein VNR11_09805 [Xanthobacteraceae bacterium]|nr:hypothetical protein [Xanthobacteraceae bacterium]